MNSSSTPTTTSRSPGLRLLSALWLGLGLAIGGFFVGQGIERFRMADRSITVKGLAEREVPADHAQWSLSFRRAGNEFGAVQAQLARDREQVRRFLADQGFEDDEVDTMPLQVDDLFAREYAAGNQPFRFSGSGRLIVRTSRIDKVDAAARAVDPLIQAGIQLAGAAGENTPVYSLKGFNEVKAPLLAEATRNAREQAEKFAGEAGARLGRLKSANQGVITISGTGGYEGDDSASRVKRLRVVSTFQYELD
jgi:hypothetical protein